MASFSVKFDDKALRKALAEAPRLAKLSAVTAINKTVAQAQTSGTRRLSAYTHIPVRKIRERVKIKKARLGRDIAARLIALTAGVPIDTIASRGLKKGGISAAGQKFPHAFRATMKNGKELIMERRVIGGNRVKRLPIERVKIPLDPAASSIFREEIETKAVTVMPRIFEQDLRYRLSRSR